MARTPLAIVAAAKQSMQHERCSKERDLYKQAFVLASKALPGQTWKYTTKARRERRRAKDQHRESRKGMWGGEPREATVQGMWDGGTEVGPAMGPTAAEIKMGDGDAREATVQGMWDGGAEVGPAMGPTAAEIKMGQEPTTAMVDECVFPMRCLCWPSAVAFVAVRYGELFEPVCTRACARVRTGCQRFPPRMPSATFTSSGQLLGYFRSALTGSLAEHSLRLCAMR